jgi:peroxiredoxin
MGTNPRLKWYAFAISLMLVCAVGLLLGKTREKDYLSALYERRDFTLLDDQNEFFRLNSLPAKTLALLVFTPDGIPVDEVKEFYDFGIHLLDLRAQGIETMLVSRVNRDIAANFKRATGFKGRLLVDTGASVSRNAGVWNGNPVAVWSYSLVDREFHVLWEATSVRPMSYATLVAELKKAK